MKKVIGLLVLTMMLLFSACEGDSQSQEYAQEDIGIVTDSLSIEMEALKEDIEQTVDELDSLLEELD